MQNGSKLLRIGQFWKHLGFVFVSSELCPKVIACFVRLRPDWFFPVKPFEPKGDGVSFPRWDEPLFDDRPIDEEMLQGEQLWRVRYQARKFKTLPHLT